MQRLVSNKGIRDKIYREGLIYRMDKTQNGKSYYRCDRYTVTGCKGRIITNQDGDIVKSTYLSLLVSWLKDKMPKRKLASERAGTKNSARAKFFVPARSLANFRFGIFHFRYF